MNHYLCYYHIYCGQHVNYHHVIMRCDPQEIVNLEFNEYMYLLKSSKAVYLTPELQGNNMIKGLIMDGESLLKRIRKQLITSKANESISIQ